MESKLRPPATPAGAVSRTALVNRLRADLGARAISVVAPGGYGKTTLLAQWAARDERRFAWITLDRRDNDPIVLLRHLAAAIDGLAPIDGRALNALAASKPSFWSTVVPRLTSALAAAEKCVLVVEDAHVLCEPDSIEIVSLLAEHVSESSAIVISSRIECPIATRLRMRGGLLELGTPDLALTRREAELLLRSAGAELSREVCEDLLDRTEGWAGALQLAALATRRPANPRPEADEPEVAFAGDHRFVTAYLHAEYLDGLSEERLAFLRRTSLLERMSGPLCDAVLGRKHSAAELEALRSANLFLVPLDAHGEWYRYHHLFRDLLHRELSVDDAELAPELGATCRRLVRAARRPGGGARLRAARRATPTVRLASSRRSPCRPPAAGAARRRSGGSGASTMPGCSSAIPPSRCWVHASMRCAETPPLPSAGSLAAERSDDPALAPRLAVLRAAMCRDGVGTMLSDARSAVSGLVDDDEWRATGAARLRGGEHDARRQRARRRVAGGRGRRARSAVVSGRPRSSRRVSAC